MNNKWIKYRECWASGYTQWKYYFLDNLSQNIDEESAKKILLEKIMCPETKSDKFRGFQFEIVDKIPKEDANFMLKNIQASMTHHQQQIEKLQRHMDAINCSNMEDKE